jgi:glycosyltransferase involved in cell wall biosynthesis
VDDNGSKIEPASLEVKEFVLSVIIPARNEEESLPGCLASLLRQSEPGFALGSQWELIVVDDDSTDKTREIAAEAVANQRDGVILLDAPALDLSAQGGFTGKSNACWAAAQAARGRRFLFTDADTVHEAGDLSRALKEMEEHQAELLSYSPRQIVNGFWQHAVMPLIFSELASIYPSKQVNDPQRRLAAANGQFLLVESDAYFAVGGHRAVGRDILEDVALARNIKQSQRKIWFRYAPDALSARMYRTAAKMVEGWSKNFALLFPRPLSLALWRVLDVLLFFGLPALALGIFWLLPWQRGALFLLWARTIWRFYSRVARSNFPAWDIVISILGVPLFVYMLFHSVIAHRIKRSIAWKGREYKSVP